MDHNTIPNPIAAGVTGMRTWDSLTFSERRIIEFMLDHDAEFGRDVRQAAGDDHDFALWLLAAGNAFADIVQAFPRDLADPAWRQWYKAPLSPRIAAKVALNLRLQLKPTAHIIDEQLVCPVCNAVGEIIEQDTAIRANQLDVDNGAIFAGTGDSHFEHTRNLCQRCGSTVRLPKPIEDWS